MDTGADAEGLVPRRRMHTKSRRGCRRCKSRHIKVSLLYFTQYMITEQKVLIRVMALDSATSRLRNVPIAS